MSMSVWIARKFPAELSHKMAILALRTGLWRVLIIIDALITLSWAIPLFYLGKLLRWWIGPCEYDKILNQEREKKYDNERKRERNKRISN